MNPFDLLGRIQIRIFLFGVYFWLLFSVLVLGIYYFTNDLLSSQGGYILLIIIIYTVLSLFLQLLTILTLNYVVEIVTEYDGWVELEQRKSLVLEGIQHIFILAAVALLHTEQVETGLILSYIATLLCIVSKFIYLFSLFNIRSYPSIFNKRVIISVYTTLSTILVLDCVSFVLYFVNL